MKFYKLDENKNPIPCTLQDFAEFCKNGANKIVKQTHLPDGVLVSTVFLGLDHSYGEGPPILFETMIFGGEHDQWQERYETWNEALEGHQQATEMIFEIKY